MHTGLGLDASASRVESWRMRPARLHPSTDAFYQFSHDEVRLNGRYAYLVRGLSTGLIPNTPGKYGFCLSPHPTDELIAKVSAVLGQLVGYRTERAGAQIQDVYPVQEDSALPINSGSVSFDYHTENTHHDVRPDYLGLLCIRGDPGHEAETRLALLDKAWEVTTSESRTLLASNSFYTAPSLSFRKASRLSVPSRAKHSIAIPCSDKRASFRVNFHNTRGETRAAEDALSEFRAAVRMMSTGILLSRGDLLLIDNRLIAHSRSQFSPKFDGSDRWLRRFYIVQHGASVTGICRVTAGKGILID